MTDDFTLRLDGDDELIRAIQYLEARTRDMAPAFQFIGSYIVSEINQAFRESRDPWGHPWAPLSDVTKDKMKPHPRGGDSAKPLLDTGRLRQSVTYQATNDSVRVGTDVEYATTQQFGARQGQYGRRRGPIPWGNIPARPFMPIVGDTVDLPAAWEHEIANLLMQHIDPTR